MRNILAGTIPTDLTYPYLGGYPITSKNNPNEFNGDVNVVMVNGQYMVLPNNMADLNDILTTTANGTFVGRSLPAVPGRWGEPSGILASSTMPVAGTLAFQAMSGYSATGPNPYYPGLIYNNPVRAGRSVYVGGTNDIMDDDFDGSDPVLKQYGQAVTYYREPYLPNSNPTSPNPPNTIVIAARNLPEYTDTVDSIGQAAVASERIRRFVTPIDPAGVGRVVDFMSLSKPSTVNTRLQNDYDYGNGHDNRGRTSYFRYFRAPGMPQDIRYPYGGLGPKVTSYFSHFNNNSYYANPGYFGLRFLMPQFYPAGSTFSAYTANPVATGASDIHNNPYHGYQSMLTPEIVTTGANPVTSQAISAMGAMPYDWDNSLNSGNTPQGDVPAGYPTTTSTTTMTMPYPLVPPLGMNFVNTFAPTIDPYAPQQVGPQGYNANILSTSVNSSSGPNFGPNGNPYAAMPMTPIGYGGYLTNTDTTPYAAPVVNGYLGGSLNKDEADEMNLYAPNRSTCPTGRATWNGSIASRTWTAPRSPAGCPSSPRSASSTRPTA